MPDFDELSRTQRQAKDRHYSSPLADAPWKKVRIDHLTKVERFARGAGWGANAWGERYKGPTTQEFYVRLPYEANQTHNILVHLEDRTMIIECGQAPAFTKPKNSQSPDLIAYFPWMGGWEPYER